MSGAKDFFWGSKDVTKSAMGGAWSAALKESWKKENAGKQEYKAEVADKMVADNGDFWTDYSGATGYKQEKVEAASASSFFGDVGKNHGMNLWQDDSLAAPISNIVKVDDATQATDVSEALYGKRDYGPEPKTYAELFLGVAGSVMDVGFGTAHNEVMGNGAAAASFMGIGGASEKSERRDMYGNTVRSDGINDYVEMNGTRYNIGLDGSYRECDIAGNEITRQQDVSAFTGFAGSAADGGGLGGFYGSGAGWGGEAASTSSSLYGYSPAAEQASNTSWFSGPVLGSEGVSAGWGSSGWDSASSGMSSFYGSGGGDANTGSGSWFWGGSTEEKDKTSWWGGGAKAAEQQQQQANSFYSSDNKFWNNPFEG